MASELKECSSTDHNNAVIDNHFGGCAVFAPDFLDQISANLNMNNSRDLFICELFFFKLHVHVRFYLIQI